VYGYTRKLGVRLGHTVSVGNSSVTDISDCLDYFAGDSQTAAIALYIEGVRDGDKFISAARRAVSIKPVVALYVGGTTAGARAGMSHTGALAGDDDLYDGIFNQCGILRAFSVEELLDASWALSTLPPLRDDRVCVLTNAGGPGASMADSCNREGLEVPLLSGSVQARLGEMLPHTATLVNPVDMTYHMNFVDLYDSVPRMLLDSGEVDGIVMYGIFGSLLYRYMESRMGGRIDYHVDEVMPVIMDLLEQFTRFPREYGKPIIVSSFWGIEDDALAFLADNGIPVYPSPERAVRAMAALRHRGRVLEEIG
jgi:acetyltransferase